MKFRAITLIQFGGFKDKHIKRLLMLHLITAYQLIYMKILNM